MFLSPSRLPYSRDQILHVTSLVLSALFGLMTHIHMTNHVPILYHNHLLPSTSPPNQGTANATSPRLTQQCQRIFYQPLAFSTHSELKLASLDKSPQKANPKNPTFGSRISGILGKMRHPLFQRSKYGKLGRMMQFSLLYCVI